MAAGTREGRCFAKELRVAVQRSPGGRSHTSGANERCFSHRTLNSGRKEPKCQHPFFPPTSAVLFSTWGNPKCPIHGYRDFPTPGLT